MSQKPLKKFIRDFYKLRRDAELLGLKGVQYGLAIASNSLGDDICTFERRAISKENEARAGQRD